MGFWDSLKGAVTGQPSLGLQPPRPPLLAPPRSAQRPPPLPTGAAPPDPRAAAYDAAVRAGVPVRKVTLEDELPPGGAPPPGAPGAPPPGALPDVVQLNRVSKQSSGTAGVKLAPDVQASPGQALRAESDAAVWQAAGEDERLQKQQELQSEVEEAYRPEYDRLNAQAEELQSKMREAAARQEVLDAEAARLREADPNRWWSSRTRPQRIMLTVASVAGGALEGLTGVKNDIPLMIQREIDRDVELQLANYNASADASKRNQTTFGQLVDLYGSIPKARAVLAKAKAADLASGLERMSKLATSGDIQARALIALGAARRKYGESQVALAKAMQGDQSYSKTTQVEDQFAPASAGGQREVRPLDQKAIDAFDTKFGRMQTRVPLIFSALVRQGQTGRFGDWISSHVGGWKGLSTERARENAVRRWGLQLVMGEGGEQGSGANFKQSEVDAVGSELPLLGDSTATAAYKIRNATVVMGNIMAQKAIDQTTLGNPRVAELFTRRVRDFKSSYDQWDRDYFRGAQGKEMTREGIVPAELPWMKLERSGIR